MTVLPEDAKVLSRVILGRRDVRGHRFTDRLLEDETVQTILKAGVAAPSVGFSQPWRFVVIRSAETKAKIRAVFDHENTKGAAQFTEERARQYKALKLEGILEAPVNIAVFYEPPTEAVLGQTSMEQSGLYSVVCAIQNMWLMARTLDVGLGWVSIIDPVAVKNILNAPVDSELVGYLCLGYVDEFGKRPELEERGWEKRKALSDLVFEESF